MPNITVTIRPGLAAVGKAIGSAGLDQEMHNIIRDFAYLVENYSKQVTPVDTGRLRASIGTGFLIQAGITMGGVARVAPHTAYAGFVHEGTKKMKSRPFMKWGVEFAQRKITDKDIANRLDKKLRESLSKL